MYQVIREKWFCASTATTTLDARSDLEVSGFCSELIYRLQLIREEYLVYSESAN